jgi:hypothetical protein
MPNDFRGYVDLALGTFVSGWAVDASNFDRVVDVEVLIDGKVVALVPANRYRSDLLHAGFGNGRHSFEAVLPQLRGSLVDVRARIFGSQHFLTCGSTEDVRSLRLDTRVFLRLLAADIVNNCNLRCPFCLVDYSGVKKTELMSKDTFLRMIPLMYTVPEGSFWLSCLHEPTLNPELAEFLHLVPQDCRKKISFTTNMARKLPESEFHGWASSGIHHINISMDTMNPDLFAVLRKNGRYHIFEENLQAMARIFPQYSDAPQIRYITMAFRSNLEEIPKIVEATHTKYLSTHNEIRYTYNVQHITDDFRREHYLRKEDWAVLDAKLKHLPYPHAICFPEDGYEKIIEPAANYFDIENAVGPPRTLKLPLSVRGRHDGTLIVVDHERFRVNVNSSEDPLAYLRAIRPQ